MRSIRYAVPTAVLAFTAFAGSVSAQTATASATYEVQAINEIGVSGDPGALTISTAAGMAGVTDNSTTWSVTTNQTGAKITGEIDTAMDTDVTLGVNLAAPAGATSAGDVALGTVAGDLVTGITELDASALGVTYTLSALPSAGVVASTTKTVTYTITGGV